MQKVLSMNTYRAATFGTKAFAFAKRSFDILFSLALILVLLPLGLVVSIVAAVDTKGTPIFIQTRMGRNNVPFKMLKFRTMSVDAPSDVATCKLDDPDRYISKVGGLIRRLSIDELPQLINIFFGQMSFVGPRPVVLTETELLELRTRNGACSVRPGLTGVAQTSGRDKVSVNEKAKMDAFYANNASLQLDCRVLMLTVGYVLRSQDICEGAPVSRKAENGRAERSA